jgi:CRISPR-associated endonuclease/helicase Cas3
MDFDTAFHQLTRYSPFPWQRALYQRFTEDRPDNFPASCNIPTGLGKTSVIAIWLLALANHPDKMPRRLVYVVNRRTVVDQTTNEVIKLRENLPKLNSGLGDLAISTLRGQYADNREWSADPSRPAVICGTVDMIGSRLLFSGYGVGFRSKPLHAGFLGQDVLLVHDEAHLEPAFQELLVAIQREQERCKEFGKFRLMELTATTRGGEVAFGLSAQDHDHPIVKERIHAKKAVHLHANEDENKLADEIAKLAIERFQDSKRAILIFVRKVDDVYKISKRLPKSSFEQLTGTLRGKERDDLVNKPIFRRFLLDKEPTDETVYLVCTSAGEVGVNISADHLICDLSTFEGMAQRFGRVNRFGKRDDTEIHVVHPAVLDNDDKLDELDKRRKRTLDLLKKLNGNGSPAALSDLIEQAIREGTGQDTLKTDRTEALRKYILSAYAPPPTIVPTSDILFDAWALTCIRGKLPGRPPVEPYLHGLSRELPETHVAWREEVRLITGELLDTYKPGDLLEEYPLKPHELLRDRSDRVFKHVTAIAERHPDDAVWLVDDDGNVDVLSLKQLADKETKERINYRTILLSPLVGGLRDGLLNGDAEGFDGLDVADNDRRVRVWDRLDEKARGMRLILRIDFPTSEDDDEEAKSWHWFELPKVADGDGSKSHDKPVTLRVHVRDVVDHATGLAKKLGLSEELMKTIKLAAEFHDLGKKRDLWQRSIGHRLPKDPQPDDWLGKSGRNMRWPGFRTDYRHEFGSLVDVLDPRQPFLVELQQLNDDMKDLILHLIATHHGRGRPHFPVDEAFDPEQKEIDTSSIAAEVPRRFARLQRKYGRWGLAYLESLLRAADWAASGNPSDFVEEDK